MEKSREEIEAMRSRAKEIYDDLSAQLGEQPEEKPEEKQEEKREWDSQYVASIQNDRTALAAYTREYLHGRK